MKWQDFFSIPSTYKQRALFVQGFYVCDMVYQIEFINECIYGENIFFLIYAHCDNCTIFP